MDAGLVNPKLGSSALANGVDLAGVDLFDALTFDEVLHFDSPFVDILSLSSNWNATQF